MNKFLIVPVTFSLLAMFSACGSAQQHPDSYTVKGELDDTLSSGKMIYIMRYDDNKILDSTRVEGNKFTFTGKADTASMCRIDVTHKAFGNFILENGTIQVNLKEYNRPSGTSLNEAMAEIAMEEDSLVDLITQKRQELKKQYPDELEFSEQWSDYWNLFKKEHNGYYERRCKELYEKHNNDAVGFYLLYTLFMNELEPEMQETIMNGFGPWLKSTNLVHRMSVLLAGQKNTAVGKPFVDIKGKDADGKDASLSDFIGKGNYVLIDMWSSWCGPCRGEVPNLAQLHNRYKNKGLTVVGIFVWDEESNLKKAMADEKITWPQIIDTGEKAMESYGVSGIPQIILFAPDGTIVERNLRGENMIRTINKIMSNK